MNNNWFCLIFLFVGAMLADISFDIIYIHKVFGDDLHNIPNRVFYGFHFMGLAMAIMGLFQSYELVMNQFGWKNEGAKVDLSLFKALKTQVLHVLKKVKAIIKL
jgi:hypothetical protein